MTETIWQIQALAATVLAIAVAYATAGLALKGGLIGLPNTTSRLGSIDGLRGFLALGVFVHHFVVWTRVLEGHAWEAPSSHIFNNAGQASVALFFMVTGALFYDKISLTGRPVSWPVLYVSRLFRLVPLYWFAVAIVFAIVLLRTGLPLRELFKSPSVLVDWLTFQGMPDIAGAGAGQIVAFVPWTLRYEWLFYLSLPLVYGGIILARRTALPAFIVPCGIVALGLVLRGRVIHGWQTVFIAAFGLGMLSIELARHGNLADRLRSPLASYVGSAALAADYIGFSGAFGIPQIVLLSLFFAPVVAGNTYFSVLDRPNSRVLGDASYSIYLLHGIILSIAMTEILPWLHLTPGSGYWPAIWALLPVLACVLVWTSIATFASIERPAIELGRRLAANFGNTRAFELTPRVERR